MIKAYITPPIAVAFREDDRTLSTEIARVDLHALGEGQAPPSDDLVTNCAIKLRDRRGNPIPREVLAGVDLEGGLRAAFREALDFIGAF